MISKESSRLVDSWWCPFKFGPGIWVDPSCWVSDSPGQPVANNSNGRSGRWKLPIGPLEPAALVADSYCHHFPWANGSYWWPRTFLRKHPLKSSTGTLKPKFNLISLNPLSSRVSLLNYCGAYGQSKFLVSYFKRVLLFLGFGNIDLRVLV